MNTPVIFFLVALFSMPLLAVPTCTNPRQVYYGAIIDLSDDIVIADRGTPVVAGSKTGNSHIVFTSQTHNKIIVKKNGVWDLSSFKGPQCIIELTGNAELICEPGAKILFKDGTIRLSGEAKWRYDKM